jgi:hypothetical protein
VNEQLALHAEGNREPRQATAPSLSGGTSVVPRGDALTFPTDKATASQFAIGWRRRGFNVGLAQQGRQWVVVER